ncbi:DUF2911 domain-containing protein [Olivibacter sp. CPCC 100613]|uniref:DUF2911 domain-containing protein n=1 Tax=Olivibacter sp. CPCC 100613 TaxID=3079931 RepID=UPI002FF9687F
MKPITHIRYPRITTIFFVLLMTSFASCGKSPHKSAVGKIGQATISIDYSSPSVKGRTIWGALVPYDKIWRAGANAATVFETDKDLTIDGKNLPAGRYSLFAIPGKTSWTMIFNSQTGQSGIKQNGEANLDRSQDVLTISVQPISNPMMENLTYEVNEQGIALVWEKVRIPINIK